MNHPYYKLPLRLDIIIRPPKAAPVQTGKKNSPFSSGKEEDAEQSRVLPGCSLKESIAQNLHLIISTYRGEVAYSEEYGCSLWDEEFNIQMNLRWKEEVCESLKATITKFEKRLTIQDIKVMVEEQDERTSQGMLRLRRKVRVEIGGIIRQTNEQINFRDVVYVSPLAQK